MSLRNFAKAVLPRFVIDFLRRPTKARRESNAWLRAHCRDVKGVVLSIGSGRDDDREGDFYRNYFPNASSYTTSEPFPEFDCDLLLDVRHMPEVAEGSYDCVYCSGVLEHVDDFQSGLDEITRVLKPGGILLLGLPFRQPIHMGEHDFWRFTEHGIRFLLKDSYVVQEMASFGVTKRMDFPATYWVKASKPK